MVEVLLEAEAEVVVTRHVEVEAEAVDRLEEVVEKEEEY